MEILDMNRIVKGVKIWYRGVVGPFELIQDNFGSLVGFSATFRLLSFFVLFPILAWTERLWLLTNKTTVIDRSPADGRYSGRGDDVRTVRDL